MPKRRPDDRKQDTRREQKLELLRHALIEGEKSGIAGPLDMDRIKRQARAGLDTEEGWSPRFVETLACAHQDKEARDEVDSIVADIARNRTRKKPREF